MHRAVYSTYCGELGNEERTTLAVAIIPCFGTTCRKFEDEQMDWCVTANEILKDETLEKRDIFIAPETQWLVKVREVQEKYKKKKLTEKRLYFYDAEKGSLSLYTNNITYSNDKYQYSLERMIVAYQAIDKRYPTPNESCFVLGRVRRTIDTKNGNLMDFIEPVTILKLDYEEEYDWCGNEKERLGNKIFRMLQISILKEEPTGLIATRIRNKMNCSVKKFLEKLDTALRKGDVKKIKTFCDVVDEPQDCSKEKFQILANGFKEPLEEGKEICCYGSIMHWIQYENGEQEDRPASWIAENISRCTNKKVVYWEKRQQYNFY